MSLSLLAAEGLCKRYGAIQACRDISFEIEEGEALAIVGEFGLGQNDASPFDCGSHDARRGRSSLSHARRRCAESFLAVGG